MTKLDDKTIMPFPDSKTWAELYAKHRDNLVACLNHAYCLADREDAVEEAFHKLMYKKDALAYGEKLPRTEKDWFNNLRWQARSALSHMKERSERHAKYVERAAEELENEFVTPTQALAIDGNLREMAVVRALDMLREEQDLSRRDIAVYMHRISGESSKKVAQVFGIKPNNVDQIKYRVSALLKKYGRCCFRRALKLESSRGIWERDAA